MASTKSCGVLTGAGEGFAGANVEEPAAVVGAAKRKVGAEVAIGWVEAWVVAAVGAVTWETGGVD